MDCHLSFARSSTTFVAMVLFLLALTGASIQAQSSDKMCAQLDSHNGLRLATGPAGGAYEKLGRSVSKEAEKVGIHLQLCDTQGSIENGTILSQGAADLAFVQSDNILDLWSHAAQPALDESLNTGDTEASGKRISLVTRLYSERLHLLIGEDTGIYSIGNLKGKDVWLGPEGSGSRNLAFEVLRAAGFEDTDIYLMDYCPSCSLQEALGYLASGKISALFRSTSIPTEGRSTVQKCEVESGPIAYTMCLYPEVRLFSLDEPLLHALAQNPRYCEALIPRNVYPNQNYAVATVGVEAMLVTTMQSGDSRIKALFELLDRRREAIEKDLGSDLDLLNAKLEGVTADELSPHLHDQVRSKLLLSSKAVLIQRLSVVVILIVLIWFLLRPSAQIRAYVARVRFAVCLFLLVLLWLALSYSLYWTEHRYSVDYRSPWEASWSVLRHYAHGLQTPAMTPLGREVAFFGLGVFILLAGSLRSTLVDGLLDRSAKVVTEICTQHLRSSNKETEVRVLNARWRRKSWPNTAFTMGQSPGSVRSIARRRRFRRRGGWKSKGKR